jgi:hypothetical protein
MLALRQTASRAGYLFLGGIIAAAALYFWRFKVPVLAGVIAVALTLLAFLQTAIFLYDGVTTGAVAPPRLEDMPQLLRAALYMPLVCGLIVFATGVLFDIRDRDRQTVWSDCAFWLHVVSAPMLVHPLFILATGQDVAFGHIEPDANATVMLALLIAAFVLVALAIDRRSLLVPTLAYFGSLGIYYLVNSASNSTGIPPFALDTGGGRRADHLLRRRLAAHQALDHSPATPHIGPQQTPSDQSVRPMTTFSPREIVSELDRFIIGQKDAKRAVAIALRNRWRRQQLTGSDARRGYAQEHPDDRARQASARPRFHAGWPSSPERHSSRLKRPSLPRSAMSAAMSSKSSATWSKSRSA